MCHRSGSLQFSVSHLSSDSAWGCSIPFKKTEVASPLEWALDNSLLCYKQTDTCHRISDGWWQIPCVLKRSHSWGILTLALGYRDPTQQAYWYLPWDCYSLHASTQCAHSRGILILAVGLLPILHAHSVCPLKRHTDTCRGISTGSFSRPTLHSTQVALSSVAWIFTHTFTLVVIVTCSSLKPTHAHSRDNTIKLSWASHHYHLFWIYY